MVVASRNPPVEPASAHEAHLPFADRLRAYAKHADHAANKPFRWQGRDLDRLRPSRPEASFSLDPAARFATLDGVRETVTETPAPTAANPAPEPLEWYVAHTRPRCEKKLVDYCNREGFEVTLPLYRSVKKYRGKTEVFHKPLFPGYVFLRLLRQQRQPVFQSDYVANLLEVPDQEEFAAQLEDILTALDEEVDVRLAPTIGPGVRVRIKRGPLQGMEAWVENRSGMTEVLLRLDFIGQAAAVKVSAEDLELA